MDSDTTLVLGIGAGLAALAWLWKGSTPAPGSTPGGNPSFSYTTSKGGANGANLQPGDTWQMSITGAAPNQPVTVSGSFGGNSGSFVKGNTDASGNFQLSGTIPNGVAVGTWVENWSVGGQLVGTVSFATTRPAGVSGLGGYVRGF